MAQFFPEWQSKPLSELLISKAQRCPIRTEHGDS